MTNKIAYIAALFIAIAACGSDSSETPDGSMDTMATKKPKTKKPKTDAGIPTDADDTIVAPAPDAMEGKDASGGAGGAGGNIGIGGEGGKMPAGEQPKKRSELTYQDFMYPQTYAIYKLGDKYMFVQTHFSGAIPGCKKLALSDFHLKTITGGTYIRVAVPADENRYYHEGPISQGLFLENAGYRTATIVELFTKFMESGSCPETKEE